MCFGVCRYYFALRQLIDEQLSKPLRAKDRDIDGLLLTGAYQLFCMRIPDHAAVNETVQAASLLKKPWARGLLNGVLRKLSAAEPRWQQLLETGPEPVRLLHPQWLIDRIRSDWPDHWQDILAAGNLRAPMTLRVNRLKTSVEDYLAALSTAGIAAHRGRFAASCLYLEAPGPVDRLPGFRAGLCSVQDEASQLVPGLLELAPAQRVLDACAAPGGKTAHCLESEPSLTSLTAVDIDARRARSIEENLRRLELHAELKVADAADTDSWWDGQPFQRILLDAPCSATGVIRRHPDIKLLRTPAEVEHLAVRQQELLQRLWACLEPGGLLLYTTCSLLKQENQATIARFLERTADAKHQAIEADWGLECEFGRQLFPDPEGSDGFYYAVIRKSGAAGRFHENYHSRR
ncbi:MAG: 16S rRNA (cytosine(967)-C(5))-methyltransferase RsmB, partial [Pseudomonadales bacterium]|nr:16S rRNA (cytosine(967)-C(5))-methyltransferase RsmB [Pseudomonadales bacterium]